MGFNEGSLQVVDIEVVIRKLTFSITIRYILSSVALVVFVFHTVSYLCDSMCF